jgi:type VI secretion system protein ImpL
MAARRPAPLRRPPARRSLAAAGVAAFILLAGLIWIAGPGLEWSGYRPLAAPSARLAALGALAVLVLAALARIRRHRAGRSRALALPAPADTGLPPVSGAGLDILRRRATAAMARMGARRSPWRGDGRATYRLPWYLVAGAPGSGKTALVEALGGVADDPDSADAAAGAAWKFAGGAVLVDTGGWCSIPDGRTGEDPRAWTGLLGLLKSVRPRQPVNGVLLTISLPDLVAWNAAERRVHAQAIRRRLAEARRRLGVRLPVHVVCTKADRLAGFGAFFDSLTEDERRQVWGVVFPADDRAPPPVEERVGQVFGTLVGRLDARLLARLNQEPDIRVRAAAFGFPLQVAALEERLAELLGAVWAPEAGIEPPLLRGVYLTSARRAPGQPPVDALALGLPPPADPPSPEAGGERSFLDRLLPDALLPEANLVGEDRALARRRRLRQALAFAGMVVGAFAVASFWARSYQGNVALVAETDAAVARIEEALRQFDAPPRSLTRVEDTDFAALVPVLDAMRALPGGYAERGRWPSFGLTGGLYQGGRLGQAGEAMYARALRSLFLSRVLLRLEDGMRVSWLKPDDLQDALRAYLMVGGRLPLDRAHLTRWFETDWSRTIAGPNGDAVRRALSAHLAALFDLGFASVPLDEALVERARKTLEEAPPSASP